MEKFQLIPLFDIIGIGAASGLVFTNNRLFIVSDSSSYLYQYDLNNQDLTKIALVENSQDHMIKKEKFDFEAITLQGNSLSIFGSGSTENRNKKFSYDLTTSKIVEEDLKPIYSAIQDTLDIASDELNIEGALYKNGVLHLFQRGNGSSAKNGIVLIGEAITFIPITLPKIKHVEATFTDAILVEDKIYFLAAAEDTTSTYDDGEVLGSMIGCLDSATFTVEFTHVISDNQKFEGLTLYKKTATQMELLLCEDNDTDILETTIFKLTLSK